MIDVTAAVMRRNNEIFVARRAVGKHLELLWEFPGGKVEPGEDSRACLKREMLEEFGIHVSVHEFLGESVFDYGDKIVRLLAYSVTHLSGEIVATDHDSIRWVTAQQLLEFDWAPADLPFAKQLASEVI